MNTKIFAWRDAIVRLVTLLVVDDLWDKDQLSDQKQKTFNLWDTHRVKFRYPHSETAYSYQHTMSEKDQNEFFPP